MDVFVNRTINFKRIKAVGLDMDYTLVRYDAAAFEKLTYDSAVKGLIELRNYPEAITQIAFDYKQVIQGLVIDKKYGTLLKLSRFGKVKMAYHGHRLLPFGEQQKYYQERVIELSDDHIQSLDTNFSISNGVLYQNLVELKNRGLELPDYLALAKDVRFIIDLIHRDGTLKSHVRKDLPKYIIPDEDTVKLLERWKSYKKKLLIITNSDFEYTKLLLNFTINPFLKNHKNWQELFDVVITFSMKPRFFNEKSIFLKIDPKTGMMSNHTGSVAKGIFQGGNAEQLEQDIGIQGSDILYFGDHIYGDVVSIKKTFNWRTALVLDGLQEEMEGLIKGSSTQGKLDALMSRKVEIEDELNELYSQEFENGQKTPEAEVKKRFGEMDILNEKISKQIVEYQKYFNPNWGELMRAGNEESRFAGQVEKYACLYMVKFSDLINYSPRHYFRPARRVLPHELSYLASSSPTEGAE